MARNNAWLRLGGFGLAVALLHVVGWGLFVYYARTTPALAGLGTLAYTFGLRHAFDADHIAAIDNTTRKFLAATWLVSFLVWKLRGIEQRWSASLERG